MVNKGQIHEELRYFWGISLNSIKSDDELRRKIRDFDKFRKITQRWIHRIKSHSIWIKICGEIKEQKLGRISKREERENKIKSKINLIYDSKMKSDVIRRDITRKTQIIT